MHSCLRRLQWYNPSTNISTYSQHDARLLLQTHCSTAAASPCACPSSQVQSVTFLQCSIPPVTPLPARVHASPPSAYSLCAALALCKGATALHHASASGNASASDNASGREREASPRYTQRFTPAATAAIRCWREKANIFHCATVVAARLLVPSFLIFHNRILVQSVMWREGDASADVLSVIETLGLLQRAAAAPRPRLMHTVMASGGWSNRRLALIAGVGELGRGGGGCCCIYMRIFTRRPQH